MSDAEAAGESRFSEEFEAAFSELSAARIAWEDDPRDAALIARLGAARIRLEEARTAMKDVLGTIHYEDPNVHRPFAKIEGEPMKLWQTIQDQS